MQLRRKLLQDTGLQAVILMKLYTPSEFEKVKSGIKIQKRDLLEENENIALVQRYHMSLQNINLSDKAREYFKNNAANKDIK